MADSQPTGLMAHADTLFRSFLDARKTNLETRWNENRSNYLAEFKALWKTEEGKDWRSQVTPDTVRQKVLTVFAIVVDLALQSGKIPFEMRPSRRLLREDAQAADTLSAQIEAASDLLDAQLARCHADREYSRNLMYALLYGRTYAKRVHEVYSETGFERVDIPGVSDLRTVPTDLTAFKPSIFSEEGPGWLAVSNWEVWTDPEANYDPRKGKGWFHARRISPAQLRARKDKPYFDNDAIDRVLEAGKKGTAGATQSAEIQIPDESLPPYLRNLKDRRSTIWYREAFISVPAEQAVAYEAERMREYTKSALPDAEGNPPEPLKLNIGPDDAGDGDEVWVHMVMANGEIVRYVRCEAEDNPMYSAACEDVPDEEARGIADSAKTSHEAIAKVMRAIEDNVNWACNVQGIAKPRMLQESLPTSMKPGQVLIANDSCKSAADAFDQIKLDPMIQQLVELLAIWEKYSDWSTMTPKISQGQVEKNQATATEILKQTQASDNYTGMIIRNFDEGLIEPITTDIFRENMLDPAIQEGKGDFVVQALGFQSFRDRVTRIRIFQSILTLALSDPRIMAEFKLRKLLEPMVAASQIDVDSVMLTDEEKAADAEAQAAAAQAEQQAQQPAPAAPDIATQARAAKDQAMGQAALLKAQADAAKVEMAAEQAERNDQNRLAAGMGLTVPS
jgi:hypothetical protein